jgi:hypothetical protein
MSFQAKGSNILGRQLAAQEIIFTANAVAGTSDLPGSVTVANGTIADTVITLIVGEAIAKCFSAEVRNRATGAIVPLEAVPSIAVANAISVQIDGTGLTDLAVTFKYKVQE